MRERQNTHSAREGSDPAPFVIPTKAGELEERMRGVLRRKQYSIRTEGSYIGWYKDFARWHKPRKPWEMGAEHISAYLTHLAQNRAVTASTQNQALNALIFLYREVMGMTVEGIDAQRAKHQKRLPIVLTKEEVNVLLSSVTGEAGLLCQLLYGCGLRVAETLSLRIKDVHLEAGNLEIRGGKGDKDRTVTLPKKLLPLLVEQRARARVLFDEDRHAEEPGVALPHATETKNPSAGKSWPWFWFWPSRSISTDPRSGTRRRHHLHDIGVTRELAKASGRAGITRRVTAHALRHSFATHLVLRGVDIRSIQQLLGHAHVSTTEIYTELAKTMRGEITSPLDDL